jgi:hypothetical protein
MYPPAVLSVLTLNLWHDAGPWERRAARIRAWIDRLDRDLIGFQEALRGSGFDRVGELLEDRYIFTGFPRRGSGEGRLATCRVVCDDEREGVWPTDPFGVYAELQTDPIGEALEGAEEEMDGA